MKKRIAFIVLLVTTLVVSFTGTSYAKTQEFDFSIDWGYWYGGSWGWWSSSWEATASPETTVLFRNILKYQGITQGIYHTFSDIPLSRNLVGPSNLWGVRAIRMYEEDNPPFLTSDWNSYFCLPGPKFQVVLSPESRVIVDNTTITTLFIRVQKNGKWHSKWEELEPGEITDFVGNNLLVQANTAPIDSYEYQCGWIEWNNPFK